MSLANKLACTNEFLCNEKNLDVSMVLHEIRTYLRLASYRVQCAKTLDKSSQTSEKSSAVLLEIFDFINSIFSRVNIRPLYNFLPSIGLAEYASLSRDEQFLNNITDTEGKFLEFKEVRGGSCHYWTIALYQFFISLNLPSDQFEVSVLDMKNSDHSCLLTRVNDKWYVVDVFFKNKDKAICQIDVGSSIVIAENKGDNRYRRIASIAPFVLENSEPTPSENKPQRDITYETFEDIEPLIEKQRKWLPHVVKLWLKVNGKSFWVNIRKRDGTKYCIEWTFGTKERRMNFQIIWDLKLLREFLRTRPSMLECMQYMVANAIEIIPNDQEFFTNNLIPSLSLMSSKIDAEIFMKIFTEKSSNSRPKKAC